MSFSRRKFLQTLGTGATAAVTMPVLGSARGVSADSELWHASDSKGPILLNSNENAYGCSDLVLEAIREAGRSVNRYPRTEYQALTERIAKFHGVSREQVILGCGSADILCMASRAFLGPGKKVIVGLPTYEVVGNYARSQGAEVAEVPLNKEWAHDLEGMLARVDPRTTLVYICNPNNPTGSITPRKDIEAFLGELPATANVVIDEAYHHYMNPSGLYASFLDRPVNNPRLIVTRTFSKIYALAGLRLGYGIAARDVAERLCAQRLNLDVNVIAAHAGLAALEDTDTVEKYTKINADDRQEFLNQANARMLRAIDSHANFVMLNASRPAGEVIEHFFGHNIRIGQKFPPLDNYVRVSLGKQEEMQEFWRVWDMMQGAMRM